MGLIFIYIVGISGMYTNNIRRPASNLLVGFLSLKYVSRETFYLYIFYEGIIKMIQRKLVLNELIFSRLQKKQSAHTFLCDETIHLHKRLKLTFD